MGSEGSWESEEPRAKAGRREDMISDIYIKKNRGEKG
jgi:hypothetical protein